MAESEISVHNAESMAELCLQNTETIISELKKAIKVVLETTRSERTHNSQLLDQLRSEYIELQNKCLELSNRNADLNSRLQDSVVNISSLNENISILTKESQQFKQCSREMELDETGDKIISISSLYFKSDILSDLLKGQFSEEDVIIKRFHKPEKKIVLRNYLKFRHENIISVLHHGFLNGEFHLIMENMEANLSKCMSSCPDDKYLFTEVTKTVMRDILSGIDHLHNRHHVLGILNCEDVLVNSLINPTSFKISNLSLCRKSNEKEDRVKDLKLYGSFCKEVTQGKNDLTYFVDQGCLDDMLERLMKDNNDGKDIEYYISHPAMYKEERMLYFINLYDDVLREHDFFEQREKFSSFLVLKDRESWIDLLNPDVKQEIEELNRNEKLKKSKDPSKRGYKGKNPLQVSRLARNYNHHRHPKISGTNYPRSNVNNLLRPFPRLLPCAYNGLYELEEPVKNNELKRNFNIGEYNDEPDEPRDSEEPVRSN